MKRTLTAAVVRYIARHPESTNTQVARGLLRQNRRGLLTEVPHDLRSLSASVSGITCRLFKRGELDRVVDVTRYHGLRLPFAYRVNRTTGVTRKGF
jgi:hypothetical protein